MNPSTSRIDVVDALRGFAIVSIMLLHNIEHFDLYYTAKDLPAWMQSLDKVLWDSLFFLFAGKSYAIFALLFGLTFFIQDDKRARRGEDFRLRFAWRMLLLFCFGLVNSMFYHGDILTIYAAIGLLLIPVARLGNRSVFALAMLLMLLPAEWLHIVQALPNPALKLPDPASWAYFGRANTYLMGDSVTAVWAGNLTNGKLAVINWSWENGRLCKILALFMLGMLAGRKQLFVPSPASLRFWNRTLIVALPAFLALYLIEKALPGWVAAEELRRPLATIAATWSTFAFMLVLVALFVLVYQHRLGQRVLRLIAPLGRMSLTSYVMQSIVGTTIYYGFGLGMYQHTGATLALAIGIPSAILQCAFSAWWLRRHEQGPLEALWHRATWAGGGSALAKA